MAVLRCSSVMVLAVAVAMVAIASASGAAAKGNHAPAPAVDCSSLIMNMVDCLSFVSNDSTTETPEPSCCTGLKTVLKSGPECLCEAFKNSAQLGVVLNVTKATSLPAACKVSAPSVTNCALSLPPAGAPVAAVSPGSSASSPDGAVSASVETPAMSPGGPPRSGAAVGASFSVGSVLVGVIVASLSSF